jgi:hypothetical protein
MIGRMKRALLPFAAALLLLGASKSAQAALCNQDPNVSTFKNCNITDVTTLNTAFAQADADPANTYNLYLAKKTYVLTKTLNLTQGAIYLYGERGGAFSTANQYVLDGAAKFQIFSVIAKSSSVYPYLSVVGVTAQNGANVSPIGRGGCIIAQGGEVDLQEAVVQNCHSVGYGGGIDADGGSFVLMDTSIVQNNYNDSAKDPIKGSCGGGQFTAGGGFSVVAGGSAAVYRSSIISNRGCRGGGFDLEGGSLTVANSTIAQNTGVMRGGAFRVLDASSSFSFLFNTIVENKSGTKSCGSPGSSICTADPNGAAGIAFDSFTGGTAELRGNIIAYNTIDFYNGNHQTGFASLRDCDTFFNTNLNIYNNSPYFQYSTNVITFGGNCNLTNGWWGVFSSSTFGDVTTLGLNHMANATCAQSVGGSLPAYKPLSTAFFLGQYGLHDGSNGGTTTGAPAVSDQRGYGRNDESHGLRCDVGSYQLHGGAP